MAAGKEITLAIWHRGNNNNNTGILHYSTKGCCSIPCIGSTTRSEKKAAWQGTQDSQLSLDWCVAAWIPRIHPAKYISGSKTLVCQKMPLWVTYVHLTPAVGQLEWGRSRETLKSASHIGALPQRPSVSGRLTRRVLVGEHPSCQATCTIHEYGPEDLSWLRLLYFLITFSRFFFSRFLTIHHTSESPSSRSHSYMTMANKATKAEAKVVVNTAK